MDTRTKPIAKEGEQQPDEGPTPVDFEIQKLRQLLRDAPNDGLKGTIRAMLSHSDQRDFFKLKEFFLNVCESFKELPETLSVDDIDNLIESFLQICQKYPSPLSSRAFMIFYHFLVNRERKKGNENISTRFKFSKQNLSRLGVENYLEDKTLAEYAVNYALFFMLKFDAAIHQITEQPKFIEMINWCDKRNLHKAISHNLEQVNEVRGEFKSIREDTKQSINQVFVELAQMKNTVEACLREIQYSNKRLSTTEKNVDELNALVQDDKRVIDANSERADEVESHIARLESNLNERLDMFEKSVKDEHDFSHKLSQDQSIVERSVKELEATLNHLKTHLEGHDNDLKELSKNKFNMDELELNVNKLRDSSKRAEITIENTSIKLANTMRDQDRLKDEIGKALPRLQSQEEKLIQVQTNTKNNFDKLLEANEILVNEFNKNISEFNGRIANCENKQSDQAKLIARIQADIHELQNKPNLEGILKTQQDNLNTVNDRLAEIKGLTSSHAKSIDGLMSHSNEIKALLKSKATQISDLMQKQGDLEVEAQIQKKELNFIRDRQNSTGQSNVSTELENFPALVKRLDQIKADIMMQIDGLNQKNYNLEEQFHQKLENTKQESVDNTKQLKDRIQIEVGQREAAIQRLHELVTKELTKKLEQLSDNVFRLKTDNQNLTDASKSQAEHIGNLQKALAHLKNQLGDLSQHFGVLFDENGEINLYEKDPMNIDRGTFERQGLSENQMQDKLEVVKKHLINLNLEMRNVSNKLPLYQKKILGLTHLYTFLAEYLRHPDDFSHSTSNKKASIAELNKMDDALVTAEDVGQALKVTKAKFAGDVENILNLFNKTQKAVDDRHASYEKQIANLEATIHQNIDERGLSLKISTLTKDVAALQQNWQKFKDSQNQTQNNFENYQETFVQTYRQRLEKIEADIEFLGRKPENSMARKFNIVSKNDMLDTTANDSVTGLTNKSMISDKDDKPEDGQVRATFAREVKTKLDYLEFIANDYKFGMIETGALKSNVRLYKSAVSLDEKFDCMIFFVKHYKLVEEKLTKSSLQQFYELINANRNNPRLSALKFEHFNEVLTTMVNYPDIEFENFYYVCETFYLFLSEEDNVKQCFDSNLFSNLVMMADMAANKVNVLSALIKLISFFLRFTDFRQKAISSKMVPKLVKIAQPILDYYIKDPRNLMDHQRDVKLSVIAEENSPPTGINRHSHPNLSSPQRSNNDLSDPKLISRKMNIENPFKRDEMTFFAVALFHNAFLNDEAIIECNYQSVFITLMKMIRKKNLSRVIQEVVLHTLKLITQIRDNVDINYKQLDDLEYFRSIVNIAAERSAYNDISLVAYDVLLNMSIHPEVYDVLSGIENLSKISFSVPTEFPINYMSNAVFNTHAIQTSPVDKLNNNVIAEKPPILSSTNRRVLVPSNIDRRQGSNSKQAHTPPARDRKKVDGFQNPRGKSSSKKSLNSSFNQDFRPLKNDDDFDPFRTEMNPFSAKNKPRFKVSALPSIIAKDKSLLNTEPTKKIN